MTCKDSCWFYLFAAKVVVSASARGTFSGSQSFVFSHYFVIAECCLSDDVFQVFVPLLLNTVLRSSFICKRFQCFSITDLKSGSCLWKVVTNGIWSILSLVWYVRRSSRCLPLALSNCTLRLSAVYPRLMNAFSIELIAHWNSVSSLDIFLILSAWPYGMFL